MSNKFPQLEWITVDGRPTPVPKVQHYKKGSTTETELTGHDNPFPVANYTQNSNGLWLPVSEDNPVPTRLTGSNVEIERKSGVSITSGTEVQVIQFSDMTNFPKYYVGLHCSRVNIEWEIRVRRQLAGTGSFYFSAPETILESSGPFGLSEVLDTKSPRIRVDIINKSADSDAEFSLVLMGVR